jgi:hypothetical protein
MNFEESRIGESHEAVEAIAELGAERLQRDPAARNDRPQPQMPVTFTEAQQARINEIVREAMGRAGREHRDRAEQLSTENTTLKSQLEEASGKLSAADALAARIATLEAEHRQSKVSDAITSAAVEAGFVDLEVARLLAMQAIQVGENGEITVKGSDGQPRLDEVGNPLSLVDYFREIGARKRYLVRTEMRGGSGSFEAVRPSGPTDGELEKYFGKKSSGAAADALYRHSKQKYLAMKAAAQRRGLI